MDVVLELHALEDRNHKRGSLAGARAGLAHDVDAGEGTGNETRLDGRGGLIAGLFEGGEHHVREAERIERGGGRLSAVRQVLGVLGYGRKE